MGLSYDKAEALCTRLLEEVKKVGGEIVLLWHNNTVSDLTSFLSKKLYHSIIEKLKYL